MILSILQANTYKPGDKSIIQERIVDDKIKGYQQFIQLDQDVKQYSHLENLRSQKLLPHIQNKINEPLEKRKQSLAIQLQTEQDQYIEEIKQKQLKTQPIEHLKDYVSRIRERQEKERNEYADFQLERKFYTEDDGMRKLRYDQNEIMSAIQRDKQMIMKQNDLQKNYEEEMIYAELYKRDQQKKERDNTKRLSQYQDRIQQNANINKMLKQMKQDKLNQEKYGRIQETKMLNEQYARENQKDLIKSQIIYSQNKQMMEDIMKNNSVIQIKKKQMKKDQQEKDQEYIQQQLLKEQNLKKLENEQRTQQQIQLKNSIKNFKTRDQYYIDAEKIRDQLLQRQNDAIWDMQEKKWKEEEDKRIQLMYEVYDDRAKVVENNYLQKQKVIQQKKQDLDSINQLITEYQQQQQKKNFDTLQIMKVNEQEKQEQINLKKEREKQRKFQLQKEYQEEINARNQYLQKINLQQQIKDKLYIQHRNFKNIV